MTERADKLVLKQIEMLWSYVIKYRHIVWYILVGLLIFTGLLMVAQGTSGWWFLIPLSIISIITYYAYEDVLEKNQELSLKINIVLRWISILFSVFLVVAVIFISFKWLFIIPFIGIVMYYRMQLKKKIINIDGLDKKIDDLWKKATILIISTILTFFFIASLFANIHSNPKDSFSSTWSAVDSYMIYSDGTRNTEHVVARSWYGSQENYVNDYINTIWSSQKANTYRGNLEFGDVIKNSKNAVYDGEKIIGYRNDSYFMPTDEYKGDVARIMLYMYITYKDDGLKNKYINVITMKQWSKQDPVDQRERDRNETIKQRYDYDNKLVRAPWLVGFIV